LAKNKTPQLVLTYIREFEQPGFHGHFVDHVQPGVGDGLWEGLCRSCQFYNVRQLFIMPQYQLTSCWNVCLLGNSLLDGGISTTYTWGR